MALRRPRRNNWRHPSNYVASAKYLASAAYGIGRRALYGQAVKQTGKAIANAVVPYKPRTNNRRKDVHQPGTILIKNKQEKKPVPRKAKPAMSNVKKDIKDLQKKVGSLEGIMTYKSRRAATLYSANNECNYAAIAVNDVTNVETVLGQLKYYTPATPGTFTTASFVTGTQSKTVRLSLFSKLILRNNYVTPIKLHVYGCQVKTDTNFLPTAAITQGLTDAGITSGQLTNPLLYPSESPQFRDFYKILSHKEMILQVNDEQTFTHSLKSFTYDPSIYDSETELYQRNIKSFVWLIRITGCVAHDTDGTMIGTAESGIDYFVDDIYKVEYNAGMDVRYLVTTDNSQTMSYGKFATPNLSTQGYGI